MVSPSTATLISATLPGLLDSFGNGLRGSLRQRRASFAADLAERFRGGLPDTVEQLKRYRDFEWAADVSPLAVGMESSSSRPWPGARLTTTRTTRRRDVSQA